MTLMLFDKKCCECNAPATVQINMLPYCAKHALERTLPEAKRK